MHAYMFSRMQVLTGTAIFVIFSSNIHPNFVKINYPAATGSLLQLLNLIGMDDVDEQYINSHMQFDMDSAHYDVSEDHMYLELPTAK